MAQTLDMFSMGVKKSFYVNQGPGRVSWLFARAAAALPQSTFVTWAQAAE
jgi:hypothetical protein